ncbi:unnamed protein product [Blepharisma stoltei]|uniref:Uncharacterized protein n=1 Tax=Blepharisma stoltei TaxID=1481888 RepID=A0AAU9IXX1_9CILI|nr:unnamed protein product [Blepharisma stoltei]
MFLTLLIFSLSNALDFGIEEIKLGTINDYTLKTGSHAFKARANFHRLKITAMPNGEGFDQIRWTDKLSTSLDETTFLKCPKDSAICGDAIDPSTNVQITIGACVDEIYIYVKVSKESTLSFSGSYYQGDCDPIEENLYTKCGAMTYAQCDVCGDECRLAFCKKRSRDGKDPEVKTSLCLPYNVTAEELTDRCDDYMNVDYGEWKDSCNKSLEIGNIGALTIIMLVLMTIAFFGFIGIVTWYNFKLRTTGKPPIKCFKFCPEILFPHPRQAQPAQPLRGYQPPDIEIPDRR